MPTTYSDRAAADAVLKDFFLGPVRDQLNSETLLMRRLEKNEEIVEGRYIVMPLHTGRNVGVMARRESGVVTNGSLLPAAGRQGYTDMRFLTRYNYGRIKLTGPVMASCRSQRGAFVRILDEEVKGLVRDLKNDINRQMYGDASGRIGTVAALPGGSVITVREPWDFANQAASLKWFQPGDRLLAEDWSAATSTIIGTTAGNIAIEVSSVDIKNKQLTMASAIGGALAVNDHLLRAYDAGVAASVGASTLRGATSAATYNEAAEMMGLIGILSGDGTGTTNWPRNAVEGTYNAIGAGLAYAGANASAAVGATVQGVTHSIWRSNNFFNTGVPRALSTNLMQTAFDACEVLGQATPTIGICSHGVRRAYVDMLQADRRFVNEFMLDGGFKAVDFNGIPIVPDKDCPEGTLFFLSEPNLMIGRMSDFYWLDKDGAILSRVSGVDEWEAILAWYSELATDRRNAHAVIGDIAVS